MDRGEPITSSKIAAGLLTPITGKKLSLTPRWVELSTAAKRFYCEIESRTGAKFFHSRSIVRILADEREAELFESKVDAPFREEAEPIELAESELALAPFGAFEMRGAYRLDTGEYLRASREYFESLGLWERRECSSPSSGITIFCTGYAPSVRARFPALKFRAAKGEIITVRLPEWFECRTFNRRGYWLAPTGEPYIYRAGATYSWHALDSNPTPEGRVEILRELQNWYRGNVQVLDHVAAVRPIAVGHKPILGLHPDHLELGLFNGLGSKGSLFAPFYAEQFAAFLNGEGKLESEVDYSLRVANS